MTDLETKYIDHLATIVNKITDTNRPKSKKTKNLPPIQEVRGI